MLTKGKVLYQVKLILDYLPQEEYDLIPKETIDYIEDNMEYDENFSINPNIPLEDQAISEKAYEVLERITKDVKPKRQVMSKEVEEYIEKVKKDNEVFDMEVENIKLKKLVELLKKENGKIPKVKILLNEYKEALKKKDFEIRKLKANNNYLNKCINRIPRFIRNFFIKEEVRLLNSSN